MNAPVLDAAGPQSAAVVFPAGQEWRLGDDGALHSPFGAWTVSWRQGASGGRIYELAGPHAYVPTFLAHTQADALAAAANFITEYRRVLPLVAVGPTHEGPCPRS